MFKKRSQGATSTSQHLEDMGRCLSLFFKGEAPAPERRALVFLVGVPFKTTNLGPIMGVSFLRIALFAGLQRATKRKPPFVGGCPKKTHPYMWLFVVVYCFFSVSQNNGSRTTGHMFRKWRLDVRKSHDLPRASNLPKEVGSSQNVHVIWDSELQLA